jgi:N-acetylmuramoyl-L-alanine amidase
MPIISYTTKERNLLARLMRAEAIGEGNLGMLMVGNVGVNRVAANCLDFKSITSIEQMIFQNPGGFTGVDSPLFFGKPTLSERRLANRILRGEVYYPATHALWFYAPPEGTECLAHWFNQANTGQYKHHCFYRPDPGVCPKIY